MDKILKMGEVTASNISEFLSQINPMGSVMTVHHNHNFIMIPVSLHGHPLSAFLLSHPQLYKHCNNSHVYNYCTLLIFDRIFFPHDQTVLRSLQINILINKLVESKCSSYHQQVQTSFPSDACTVQTNCIFQHRNLVQS